LKQLRDVFTEVEKIGSIEWIYFEGGEPFLYYPLMVEGFRLAKEGGFKAGTVSNAYWATTVEDAELWLQVLKELEVDDLSLSQDEFHGSDEDDAAGRAVQAAKNIGMDPATPCIERPSVIYTPTEDGKKGKPVVGGGALLKGRAADKLTEGLPTRPIESFKTCPHEELITPGRVHLDPFGHVHMCQGISMGNMWEIPLSRMVKDYESNLHPIAGPLVAGGPKRLADAYSVQLEGDFVDECHYCYNVRKALVDKFTEHLTPRQVYGLED
jgi:hypothetical protein